MSLSLRTIVIDRHFYHSLGLKLAPGVEVKPGGDQKSIVLRNPEIVQLSGKEEEPSLKLGQGRIYELKFGSISPAKDVVLIAVNPVIGRSAIVTNPGILGPKATHELSIPVYTVKTTDLSDLDWIVRIYMLS